MRITLIPTAIHACALECTQETTVKVQWVKYNTIVFKHFVDLDTSTLCFLLDHRLNYNNHYIQSTVCSRLAAGNKLQESSKLCCFEKLCRLRYIHTVFFTGPQIELQQPLYTKHCMLNTCSGQQITGKLETLLC